MSSLPRVVKLLIIVLAGLLSAFTLAVLAAGGLYLYFGPQLPEPGDIGVAQLSAPLRIYTADHQLIAEYGAQRRLPVHFKNIPESVIHAFVAAEDDRFFQHPGVDYQGILRAAWHLALTGEKTEGGSTITMQLARNLYLTRARTFTRKIKEIILALRLESAMTKDQILELYLNKIYLGNRAYGVGAAAQAYFNKSLDQLSIAEVATLAGLPKAPSYYDPAEHPKRARVRRDYVLRRMHELGFIGDKQYKTALAEPVTTATRVADDRYKANYLAEMVRQQMVKRFGKKAAYTSGYQVTTTLHSKRQRAANRALRRDLLSYDARHDWRGAEATVSSGALGDRDAMDTALASRPDAGGLVPAVVLATGGGRASLYTQQYGKVTVAAGDMPWLKKGAAVSTLIKPDDVVRLAYTGDKKAPWSLAQIPKVQGAIVALNPHNGAIEALAGGFAFDLSKFNRAIQARRQPGSAFKPFLYSAALAHGFTPATIVNDAPVVFDAPGLGRKWRPENYGGSIRGPTRLRDGLVHSINLVSIRVARDVGVDNVIKYAARFGLPAKRMPRDLSLALGSATFSPLQMARADAVFANGGYLIEPYYIDTIRNGNGDVVYQADPVHVCGNQDCQGADAPFAKQVIKPRNAYLITSMMQDVIRHGTGAHALVLHRSDLAGKTGTTNQQKDAWFTGFNSDLVAVCWVGFDKLRPLGASETGAHAALPMWIDFMRSALAGKPERTMARPPGLVTVRIDPTTGDLASGDGDGIFETFRQDNVPKSRAPAGDSSGQGGVQQLF